MTKAWPEVALGDVVQLLAGFAFDAAQFSDGGGTPLIRIRDVTRGRTKTFFDGGYDQRYVVNDGEILIGMDGQFNRARWKGGPALLNQRVCKITSSSGSLENDYLFHFLPQALKSVEDETPFVTVKHLSMPKLKSIKIPLPPLDEQRRIAAILDKADEVRSKRKAALETLETLSQAIFIEMFGDPTTNPVGWPSRPLGEVATLQRGFDLPVQNRKLGTCPIFASNGIIGSHSEGPIPGPGVITGRSGTIGLVHFSEGAFWPLNTSLFVKDFHGHEPRWVLHLLREMRLEQFHAGTGVPTLNRNVVHAVSIGVPPLEKQHSFSTRVCRVGKMEAVLRSSLREVEDLFSSLQNKAFKGAL